MKQKAVSSGGLRESAKKGRTAKQITASLLLTSSVCRFDDDQSATLLWFHTGASQHQTSGNFRSHWTTTFAHPTQTNFLDLIFFHMFRYSPDHTGLF